jgi:hypothetical protein
MARSKDRKPNDNKKTDEDFRELIAKDARFREFIKIIDLVSIMAAEKSYTNVLPKLGEIFCSRRFFIPKEYSGPNPEEESDDDDATGIWRKSKKCDVTTGEGRNWFWMNLLRRWIGLAPDVVLKQLKSTPYIQCYQANKVTDQFDKVDREQRKPDYFEDYVKLTDFAEYVEKVERIYQLPLPLPSRLYFDDSRPSSDNVAESPYVFLQEGPSWTITYEGKTVRGLTGKGFAIIHYLVSNKGKTFSIADLAREFDKVEYRMATDSANIIEDKSMIEGLESPLEKLKHAYGELKNDLRKAEDANDLPRIEKAKHELQEFEKHAAQDLNIHGKTRKFSNETFKAKDRIRRRIERALDILKQHDENTYLHFRRVLSPINSFFHSYNPDRPINWHT